MKRLAVFFSCLSLASVALSQSQPSKQEPIAEKKKPPLQAAIEADTKPAPSESEKVVKPPAKKIVYGGVLLKLLQTKSKPQENTANSGPAKPLRGLQLFNPFAPTEGSPLPRLDWKAHRPVDHRFQSPKTGEPEGIKLLLIGF